MSHQIIVRGDLGVPDSDPDSTPGLDSRLAARVGQPTPLISGDHKYITTGIPTELPTVLAGAPARYGGISILNCKPPWTNDEPESWGGMAAGLWDSNLDALAAHIAQIRLTYPNFVLVILWQHEPEAKVRNATDLANWIADQKYLAQYIHDLNEPGLQYGFCLMTWTWYAQNNYPQWAKLRDPEDWRWTDGVSQSVLDRSIAAPDGYTSPSLSMADRFDLAWATFDSWGLTRRAISEHCVNVDSLRGLSDEDAQITALYEAVWSYLDGLNGLVYYGWYGWGADVTAGFDPYVRQNSNHELSMAQYAYATRTHVEETPVVTYVEVDFEHGVDGAQVANTDRADITAFGNAQEGMTYAAAAAVNGSLGLAVDQDTSGSSMVSINLDAPHSDVVIRWTMRHRGPWPTGQFYPAQARTTGTPLNSDVRINSGVLEIRGSGAGPTFTWGGSAVPTDEFLVYEHTLTASAGTQQMRLWQLDGTLLQDSGVQALAPTDQTARVQLGSSVARAGVHADFDDFIVTDQSLGAPVPPPPPGPQAAVYDGTQWVPATMALANPVDLIVG